MTAVAADRLEWTARWPLHPRRAPTTTPIEVLDDGFKRFYFQPTSSGDANEMTSSPSSATMDELPPDELLIPVSRLTPLSPSGAPLKGLCAGLIAMHIKRQSRGS
ncbi:unnamed protein product [Arctogadus glacialis]